MTVLCAIEPPGIGYTGWTYVEWLYPGIYKVAAVRQLKKIEQGIKEKRGRGWIMESAQSHVKMHKIISKLGGVLYGEDAAVKYFKKEIH